MEIEKSIKFNHRSFAEFMEGRKIAEITELSELKWNQALDTLGQN